MKSEKEFRWLVILLTSNYTKGWFKKESGCKKDFERLVDAPENDREFNLWINELIKEGCLENNSFIFTGKSHKKVMTYFINEKRLKERLKRNSLYPIIDRAFALRKDVTVLIE